MNAFASVVAVNIGLDCLPPFRSGTFHTAMLCRSARRFVILKIMKRQLTNVSIIYGKYANSFSEHRSEHRKGPILHKLTTISITDNNNLVFLLFSVRTRGKLTLMYRHE